jgi:hypothetical protein
MIVESPGCTLSQNALRELQQAVDFYDEGSAPCRPPATLVSMLVLPSISWREDLSSFSSQTVLRNLLERAQFTFTAYRNGVLDSEISQACTWSAVDELGILGGRKTLIAGRPASTIPSSLTSSPLAKQHTRATNVNSGGRRREPLSGYSSDDCEVHEFTFCEAGDHEMGDSRWETSRCGEPNTEYPAQLWTNELGHRGLHHSPTNPSSSPADSSRARCPAPPAQCRDDTLAALEFPMQLRCGVRPSQQCHFSPPESVHPSAVSRQSSPVSTLQQLGNAMLLLPSDMFSFPIDHQPNQEETWRTFIENLGNC